MGSWWQLLCIWLWLAIGGSNRQLFPCIHSLIARSCCAQMFYWNHILHSRGIVCNCFLLKEMQTSHLLFLLYSFNLMSYIYSMYMSNMRTSVYIHMCVWERVGVKGSFWVYLVSAWVCICPELWASSLLMFYWVLTMVGLTHCLWYGVAWLKESTKTDLALLVVLLTLN